MVKVKEEPVSDDENDKNENEETIAIDHTNCLEEPTKGKAKESENLPLLSENLIKNEVISLNIEEEKESNCYMQQIKQENNNDEKEVHTKSDIDNAAEVSNDIVKSEELVVAWTDNQNDNSGSNDLPDFRDEIVSALKYE
ncbi:unnamed protein product, partial [Meganyctiphanes norvegica]